MLGTILLALLQAAQPANPSVKPFDCSAPEYRQLDFWVGDWDVVPNPETMKAQPGRKPGRNVIERVQGGCAITEQWDDRYGGTGQSVNIYDRVSQKWHQTWVSNNGSLHLYWGEFKDGQIVFMGEVPLGPASKVQGRRTVRMTLTPLGADKVRQRSESLNTDGTWSVNYDFIYTRRQAK